MIVKRVKKTNFYDIFTGNGWKNHTRVFIHNSHVLFKSGIKLTKIQFIEISKSIGVK
jgi:hypothetical protein